jgi:hypothetical protein
LTAYPNHSFNDSSQRASKLREDTILLLREILDGTDLCRICRTFCGRQKGKLKKTLLALAEALVLPSPLSFGSVKAEREYMLCFARALVPYNALIKIKD